MCKQRVPQNVQADPPRGVLWVPGPDRNLCCRPGEDSGPLGTPSCSPRGEMLIEAVWSPSSHGQTGRGHLTGCYWCRLRPVCQRSERLQPCGSGHRAPVSFRGPEPQQDPGVMAPTPSSPLSGAALALTHPRGSSSLGLNFKRQLSCEETCKRGTCIFYRMTWCLPCHKE